MKSIKSCVTILMTALLLFGCGEKKAFNESELVSTIIIQTQSMINTAKRMALFCDEYCYLTTSDFTEKDRESSKDEREPLGHAFVIMTRDTNLLKDLSRTIKGMAEDMKVGEIVLAGDVDGYIYTKYSPEAKIVNCDSQLTVLLRSDRRMVVTTSCYRGEAIEDSITFHMNSASAISLVIDELIRKMG